MSHGSVSRVGYTLCHMAWGPGYALCQMARYPGWGTPYIRWLGVPGGVRPMSGGLGSRVRPMPGGSVSRVGYAL